MMKEFMLGIVTVAIVVAVLFTVLDGLQTSTVSASDYHTAEETNVVFSGGRATMANPQCTAVISVEQT